MLSNILFLFALFTTLFMSWVLVEYLVVYKKPTPWFCRLAFAFCWTHLIAHFLGMC